MIYSLIRHWLSSIPVRRIFTPQSHLPPCRCRPRTSTSARMRSSRPPSSASEQLHTLVHRPCTHRSQGCRLLPKGESKLISGLYHSPITPITLFPRWPSFPGERIRAKRSKVSLKPLRRSLRARRLSRGDSCHPPFVRSRQSARFTPTRPKTLHPPGQGPSPRNPSRGDPPRRDLRDYDLSP